MKPVPFVAIPAIRKSKQDSYASTDDWEAHYQTIACLYLYDAQRCEGLQGGTPRLLRHLRKEPVNGVKRP